MAMRLLNATPPFRSSVPLLRAIRLALVLAVALRATLSFAQQSQIEMLNARVADLVRQGKSAEALPVAKEAVELAEKTYGPNDRRLTRSLSDLAVLYTDQGNYVAAEALINRALKLDETATGPGQADVARDMRNLATIYARQGKTTAAKAYLELALSIDEQVRGKDDPVAAMDRQALADLPRNQADPDSPYAASQPSSAPASSDSLASAAAPAPAPEPSPESSAPAAAQAEAPASQPANESGGAANESGPGFVFDTPPAASGGGCSDPHVSCDAAASHVDTPEETREREREQAEREKAEEAERRELERKMKEYEEAEKARAQQAEAADAAAPFKGTEASSEPAESVPTAAQSAAPEPPPRDGAALPSSPQSTPASGSGKSSAAQHSKTTSYDFPDQAVEGDLTRPSDQTQTKPPIIISEVTIVDDTIERYPNIEAPETVAPGQEIAVQVSLTSEQLAPETKILSGEQDQGKLKLHMAAGEERWTLSVNLTAPGMIFTRGGNTADITITHDGDSTIAAFYLRPAPNALAAGPSRDTRILATLIRNGAFIARLSRPLTIVASTDQPVMPAAASLQARASDNKVLPAAANPATAATGANPAPRQEIRIDPDIDSPDLTIVENRVGNMLRLVLFSRSSAPVEADIANPDDLHAWIQAHFEQMAISGRGISIDSDAQPGTPQHAVDYLNGFGAELYDKFAPPAFKTLFWKLMDNSYNHAPQNKHAKLRFEYIQVLSDDPAIPWELMRPARADGSGRQDFLGLHFAIARWPLGTRGSARPPQSLTLSKSAVIAPVYHGAQQLAAASDELTTLKAMQGFTQVAGDYAAVRILAANPPQGIIHFAGHGAVTEVGGVPQFAILLEDSQMDPATWQSLVSSSAGTHPLFFFNACDVGESRRFLNDVDGWAPVLLSSGASGYIGALWPVNDATAEAIATNFYRRLSIGVSRQDANVAATLARARADVYSQTGDPTALAYVFYGDPNLLITSAEPPAAK